MNALYSHATKQKLLLSKELAKFEQNVVAAPISLQGSITTTLLSLEKTITKYKQQLVIFKQSHANDGDDDKEGSEEILKYETRLEGLEKNYTDFKAQFAILKEKYQQEQIKLKSLPTGINSNMNSNISSSSSNPFTDTINGTVTNRKGFGDGTGTGQLNSDMDYQQGLHNEQNVLARGNKKLDYILEMGQQSLDGIIEQNQVLEKLQKTMTKSLSTLGVSGETIERINKRVFKDRLVFYIALVLLFLGFYLVLRFLR